MPDTLDEPKQQTIDDFLGEAPKIDDFLGVREGDRNDFFLSPHLNPARARVAIRQATE